MPAYLCTSPIPQEAPEEIDVATEEPGARRKKRRRRRVRSDSHLREEVSSSSEERDREESEREADAASKELSAALLARSDDKTCKCYQIRPNKINQNPPNVL